MPGRALRFRSLPSWTHCLVGSLSTMRLRDVQRPHNVGNPLFLEIHERIFQRVPLGVRRLKCVPCAEQHSGSKCLRVVWCSTGSLYLGFSRLTAQSAELLIGIQKEVAC